MIKRILLFAASCFVVLAAHAQLAITGKVTDEQEQPLPGATIIIDHTLSGTVTAEDGTFRLPNLKPGPCVLVVSFLGFESREVSLILRESVDIAVRLKPARILADEVVIRGIRAGRKDPVAYTNLGRQEIAATVPVKDIPFLLATTPSVVASSDGGTGVGYSSIRIRGTDPTRINVTINGIPFNDPESHEVYWVDIPDFAASTGNIQIQRGVGTSTQGAAAFGANLNFQTLTPNTAPSLEFNAAGGSFNTWKTSLGTGTGLINGHFSMDARLSKIHSDGYIDRAFTDLESAYLSGGYFAGKHIVKLTLFTGKERTYQAWGGVPSELLETNRTYNPYTYKDEVDDYRQHNAQLLWSARPWRNIGFSAALHYTGGQGYYEQFRADEELADYLMGPVITFRDTILESDLVRRKWLKNDFAGGVWSLSWDLPRLSLTAGGGLNSYSGDHFGRVIWSEFAAESSPDHEYYFSNGLKKDANQYIRAAWNPAGGLSLSADLQLRHVNYRISGTDDDLSDITQDHRFTFFNPKVGVNWDITKNQRTYLSFSIAHREPTRSNLIDAPAGMEIRPETLRDLEAGYQLTGGSVSALLNLYWMDYTDQLILTGQINDVGAPVMVNIPSSYWAGIELSAGANPFRTLKVEANLTLSRNRIRGFTEYVDDWDTWGQRVFELGTTDLSFSPSVVAGGRLTWMPVGNLSFQYDSRFVGRQFIDNTSDQSRSLDPYWVNNATASYTVHFKKAGEWLFFLTVNNFLNHRYETNAWVYSYFEGGVRRKMDGYFPQAGIHMLAGIRLKL